MWHVIYMLKYVHMYTYKHIPTYIPVLSYMGRVTVYIDTYIHTLYVDSYYVQIIATLQLNISQYVCSYIRT